MCFTCCLCVHLSCVFAEFASAANVSITFDVRHCIPATSPITG
uniref:Uncharacterized protein n=1 Tax=Anguilla anguilla TaxID=7936 RepID=A0A0E9R120_ANGAN